MDILFQVPRKMVVTAYHEADLSALASAIECSPLVPSEAMASGTPFVCVGVGNAADLLGGMTLALAEDCAEAMQDVATHPDFWLALGQVGREFWAQETTLRALVSRFQSLHGDLVAYSCQDAS